MTYAEILPQVSKSPDRQRNFRASLFSSSRENEKRPQAQERQMVQVDYEFLNEKSTFVFSGFFINRLRVITA